MNVIGARDDDRVELAARGVAVLSGVDVLEENELGDGVVGHIEQGARDALGVVIDTVDGEVVVAWALA